VTDTKVEIRRKGRIQESWEELWRRKNVSQDRSFRKAEEVVAITNRGTSAGDEIP
jgi:hypothetical protein